MKRSDADNLSTTQQTAIRHSDKSDLALARKYGVTAKTIQAVRLEAVPQRYVLGHDDPMATKKAAPKKRTTKAKKAATPVEEPKSTGPLMPEILGGPDLPRPLS